MDEIDEAIIENLLLPKRERLSNVKLGEKVGVNEATIRRRLKKINIKGQPRRDEFFDIPVNAISQRGKTVRLEDGSYEKITYRPGAVEIEETKQYLFTDLADAFNTPVVPMPPEPDAATLVACVPDMQLGKQDENGGTKDTVERFRSMLTSIVQDIVAHGGYEEIVLADVGDICEGFWNVASQAQTNDLSLTDQIRVAQRLMSLAIESLAPLCHKFRYVAVPSNHCAVRTGTGSKNRANTPDDDFGLLICDNLQMVSEGREGFTHCEFIRPSKFEETLTVGTHDGTNIAFTHGHVAGSRSNVAKWFSQMAFGRRSGMHEAHILVHGHWHNFGLSLAGDNRFVISCPSVDNGSSWFSNKSGASSEPALLTFEAFGGRSRGWRLWYV